MKPHEEEPLDLAHLREELHRLEQRVDALEHEALEHHQAQRPFAAPLAAAAGPTPVPQEDLALPGLIPAAGRATLGLAGAYLFRALAESGAVPRVIAVAVAIVYAAAWLVYAINNRRTNYVVASTYALTASLILAPLLWESTVRFSLLPPLAAAGILVVFVLLSSGAPITTLSMTATGLALMVGTGDLLPFASALLAIACVVEVNDSRGPVGRIHIPVALAADIAIWLTVYIMSRADGVPKDYRAADPAAVMMLCGAFFVIFIATTLWRTVAMDRTITVFEVVQSVLAVALAAGGVMQVTHGAGAPSIGALSALGCAGCYFTAFIRFGEVLRRNHHVFAWWGAALGVAACFLVLPESLLTLVWCAAAVVATLTGARTAHPDLGTHGTLYLVAAAFTSGLPATLSSAFAGTGPMPVNLALCALAAASVCCYLAWGRTPKAISVAPALLAAASLVALAILGAQPSPRFLPTFRSLAICVLALGFALSGVRLVRKELLLLSYGIIGLGSVKLLLEDFRNSPPALLAVALICYGGLLIFVPRLKVSVPEADKTDKDESAH